MFALLVECFLFPVEPVFVGPQSELCCLCVQIHVPRLVSQMEPVFAVLELVWFYPVVWAREKFLSAHFSASSISFGGRSNCEMKESTEKAILL